MTYFQLLLITPTNCTCKSQRGNCVFYYFKLNFLKTTNYLLNFCLDQQFLTVMILSQWDHLAGSRVGDGVTLLASSEPKPGMLLNTPQGTGRLPTTKNGLAQCVNRSKVEKLLQIQPNVLSL